MKNHVSAALSLILGLSPLSSAAQTVSASAATAGGVSGVAGASLQTKGISMVPSMLPTALALSPMMSAPALAPSAPLAAALPIPAALTAATPAAAKPVPGPVAPVKAALSALKAHFSAPSVPSDDSKSAEQRASEARKTFDGEAAKPEGPASVAASGPSASGAAPLAPSERKLWAPETVAEPIKGDLLGVTIHRLSNGMTVYLSPNRLQPRVTGHIAVRAGSRQDPTDSTGMAHYLEHMLFKGSERLGTTNWAKEKPHLEKISALYETLFTERDPARRAELYKAIDAENQLAAKYAIPNEYDQVNATFGFKDGNAHTATEETVYQVSFPSNRAEAWARTETDRFASPVFRLFQSELEAVYEEFNKGLDDADSSMWNAMVAAAFKGHPYGRSIIGLSEHLKNPSLAKMYAFYDAWYRPENMAIVLSGDFDRAEMIGTLERNFGTLRPRTTAAPVLPPASFAPHKGVEKTEIFHQAEEAVRVIWRTPAQNHPDTDALAILERVLGDPQSGLLKLHLTQAQKVKSAWGGVWQLKDAGAFLMNASPKAGQTLEQAEALMLAEIEAIKAGKFSEQDIKAAIDNVEVQEKESLESDERRVQQMVSSYINGEEWRRGVEGLERLRRVTKADVVRVAKAYLGGDRAVVYRRQGETKNPEIDKPGFTPIEIDPARRSPFAAELTAMPAAEPKPRWLEEGKDYAVGSFGWGKLYWAKNPVSDLFSLKLVIPGGFRADPRLRIASRLLAASGAGDMSPAEFEQALARLGTKMGFKCGPDECMAEINGLEQNLEESLRLMSLRFSQPNIPRGTLQQLVKIELGARKDQRQDPEAIGMALLEFAERGANSTVLADLSEKKLKALRTDEVRRLLARTFDTRRTVMYAGTASPEKIGSLAAMGRRTWKPGPARAATRIAVPEQPEVVFVHRKGMVQAHIGLFASDGPSDPADSVARRFYNTVVGGMGGVIFQEAREARSLAYSATGSYQAGARKGDDAVQFGWIGSQADKAVEAAALMQELLKRSSFGAERFESAAAEVASFYRSNAIAFRDIPATLLSWERMGLGTKDPRPALLKQALAYREADLEAVGRRLASRTLTTYVIGDRDALDMEGLKRLGRFREASLDEIFPR